MNMIRKVFFLALLVPTILYAHDKSLGIEAINNAERQKEYLFIFFSKTQSEKTLQSEKIFDKAVSKLKNQVKFVKIKTDDPLGKPIIKKFNLERSPMPFVLVVAPNGAITGGFSSFTEKQLLEAIISSGAASCLKVLQEHKLVLLCLQNKNTHNNQVALKAVRDFKSDPRFTKASEIVAIDPSDVKEHTFLKQLDVNVSSSSAMTVLISPPAVVVAKYQGPITKDQLAGDLKKMSSGCCASGKCCSGECGGNGCRQ
jgi:hypothetical protein